ncbi:MAG: YitT family protein [Synergistales bacterium]|nr:YitT family protein [Synergistales bacterium]
MRVLRRIRRRLPVWCRAEWKNLAAITVGVVLVAAGYLTLLMPMQLPAAGVNGLAVLSNYVFGISPAWVIGGANALLLAWAWRGLSARFAALSAYAVALMAVLLKLLERMPHPVMEDKLLVVVLAGGLVGFGVGLIFRVGGSPGGVSVIVMALRQRYGLEVGIWSFYLNSSVLLLAVWLVGVERAVYGGMMIYISGITIDAVLRSFDRRKQVMIISSRMETVRGYIMDTLKRGVTVLHGEGGYSNEPRPVLLTLLTPRQTMDLKHFLAEGDPGAFVVVSDASEVLGRGFKSFGSVPRGSRGRNAAARR